MPAFIRRIRGRNFVPPDALPEPPTPETGSNEHDNSKWLGASTTTATDWAPDDSNAGTITFADEVDGHRTLRCVDDTGSKRAAIQQFVTVTPGTYTWSIQCDAVTDGSDANRAVTVYVANVGTAVADFIDPRVTVGDLVPGQRHSARMEVTTGGTMLCRYGLGVPAGGGTADITISRPMLDKHNGLRDYDATDPAEEPEPPSSTYLQGLPYYGLFSGPGHAHFPSTAINSRRLNDSGYRGWRYTCPIAGTLDAVQHQIAMNFSGETTKSMVNGSTSHPFPAQFKVGMRVFNADSNWQISGSALRQFEWESRCDGSTFNARVVYEHDMADLAVTAGQRLLFLVYNREASPSQTSPSVNMGYSFNPPTSSPLVSPFYGDEPLAVQSSSQGGTLNRIGGYFFGLGIRYSNPAGVEHGTNMNDCTHSMANSLIYGSSFAVRQRWTPTYWCRASAVDMAVYKRGSPTGPLRLLISGADITTVDRSIPASEVDTYLHTSGGGLLRFKRWTMATTTFQPGTEYTFELTATGTNSSNPYGMVALRNYLTALQSSVNRVPAPTGPTTLIDQHDGNGQAERRIGGSYRPLGYEPNPGYGANLPIMLFTNGNCAATEGGLT